MLRVFAGYDPRIPQGFEVFRHSVERHASGPVAVIPLDQDKLRTRFFYDRPEDEKASTPFSLTRFLVPMLSNFEGLSLFFDGSDMLMAADVYALPRLVCGNTNRFPVSCVQHDYYPNETTKFFDAAQHRYPRKNWSSVMFFDNAECTALSEFAVNNALPSELHQFTWCEEIGSLPLEWNWLAGEDEYRWDKSAPPALVHYTLGLPIVPGATKTQFDDLWYAERQRLVDSIMLDPSLDHAT